MLLACCFGLNAHAQQINGDFDTFEAGYNGTGVQPVGWYGSNVNYMRQTGVQVYEAEGRTNKAVQLVNTWVGLNLSLWKIGSNAPAYITLGKPWAYANVGDIDASDGGTYGGVAFTYRPDALRGYIKREVTSTPGNGTANANETCNILVYLWKGTAYSNLSNISYSPDHENAKGVEVANLDRAVVGREEPARTEGDFALVAYNNYEIAPETHTDWQEVVIPLEYTSDAAPEMMNIIISAADYFNRPNIGDNNKLWADDFEFLYYSELATLTYDGQEVPVAAEMDLSTVEYDESKLSCTLTGRGATLEKAYDESTGVLTLTVKGNDWTEENRNEHVYTVQFAVPVPASEVEGTYNRQVTVEMAGSVISQTMNDILITAAGDGSYTLQLNGFFFNGSNLGNIVVPGVTAAYAEDGSISLTAPEQSITIDGPGAGLGELPVTLDMALVDGKLTGCIGIVWNNMPIQVTVGDRTVQAADVEGTYSRWLTVAINGEAASETLNDILITAAEDGSYTLQLNNFAFGTIDVGNIVVPGAQAAYAEDGSISLTATANVTIDLFPNVPLPTTVSLTLATTDDGSKVLTGEINIDFSLMQMAINVTVGDVPFQVEADGRTLTVTGTVSKQAAPAVVPADGSFLAIDLTQATLGEDVETGDFTNTQPNTLFYVADDKLLAGSNVVAGGACADLVITDAEDFYVPANLTATRLAYNRTLTAGQYAAVVLPFDVDASLLDGKAYLLDNVEDDVLAFVSAEGTIGHDTPFLFLSSDTLLFAKDTELTAVSMYATPEEAPAVAFGSTAFTGTYTSLAIAQTDAETWYTATDDEFVPATDETLPAFRAAVKGDGSHDTYRLSFDGKLVGISAPALTPDAATADVYTVDGKLVRRAADATRALEGLPAGIYIVNGKKVVK